MRMGRALRAGLVALGGFAARAGRCSHAHVEQADLTGDISTIMAAYITTAVSRAETIRAECAAGGDEHAGRDLHSMDEIVTSLLRLRGPVIVYVYPSGARRRPACSSPRRRTFSRWRRAPTSVPPIRRCDPAPTSTGDLGPRCSTTPSLGQQPASIHGRNADWAEQAVRNSVNINAEDAVKIRRGSRVSDPAALMNAIDGGSVPRTSGALVLHTPARASTTSDALLAESSSTLSSTPRSPRS
jgi:membrane-bound serine protease (ClpP class)